MNRRAGKTVGGRVLCVLVVLALLIVLVPTTVQAAQIGPADTATCKLPAPLELRHSGFPLGDSYVESTGDYRAAVLFVDFADHPSTETTEQAFDRLWRPEAEDFVERQSRRRIDITAVPHHEWLRLEAPFTTAAINPSAEAVALADANFDFTDFDAVWIVLERSAERIFGFAWTAPFEHPIIVADDGASTISNGLVLGTSVLEQSPVLDITDVYVAHEMLHTLGLPDLYDAADESNQWGFVGNFDPMGNLGGFSDGEPGPFPNPFNGGELLAWQRWQLGWVDDDQIVCADAERPFQATLSPLIARGGTKAVVVPLGPNLAMVVEARVKQRYDRDLEQEGVLVYLVDGTRFNANGSIQVQNPVSGSWPSGQDLLQPGESLEVQGITVHTVERQADGFVVEVVGKTCRGVAVTIDMSKGIPGIGTEAADVILGTSGDDIIDGLGGDDIVCAGEGADTVVGGEGDDWIDGGDGADIIRGNSGADELHGGTGADSLFGGIGDDVLAGGGGADYLAGFGGADQINGGSGPDIIFGGFGPDLIDGGPGDDRIRGLVGNDWIDGGNGADIVDGDRGTDIIDGGEGNDILRGGNAGDTVRGGPGDDDVSGGKADDVLFGGIGNDVCSGNLATTADRAGADCELIFGV